MSLYSVGSAFDMFAVQKELLMPVSQHNLNIRVYYCISETVYLPRQVADKQVARGVQGVLENPPFYESPFLENTTPPPIAIIRGSINLNWVNIV